MWSSTASSRPERRAARHLLGGPLRGLLAAALVMAAAIARGEDAPAFLSRYLSDARASAPVRMTWLGFHVYDARLYLPRGFQAQSPADSPFVLELTYARKLKGEAIAETSRDEIARLGFGSEAQRAEWYEQMRKLFPDVDKGRRIAGVNVPGQGARFYVDGRFAGSIDDPAFARAFFAIWLDPRTRVPKLREQLLAPAGSAAAGA